MFFTDAELYRNGRMISLKAGMISVVVAKSCKLFEISQQSRRQRIIGEFWLQV